MRHFTTAPAVAHNRPATDKPDPHMATDDGTSLHGDHPMESVQCHTVLEGGYYGNLELDNLETDGQRPATPSPNNIANYGGTSSNRPQAVDVRTGLPFLPDSTAERSFVALPDPFDGKKENYRRFRQQFGLFMTANRFKFKEKESMIWFTLSYMKGGDVEL
jgi:hypothetical protein